MSRLSPPPQDEFIPPRRAPGASPWDYCMIGLMVILVFLLLKSEFQRGVLTGRMQMITIQPQTAAPSSFNAPRETRLILGEVS